MGKETIGRFCYDARGYYARADKQVGSFAELYLVVAKNVSLVICQREML